MPGNARKLILPRWHSGRWLLSPDILTAYDELWMHPEDARMVEKEASHSSYNEWEAANLDVLRRKCRGVLIVRAHPAHRVPADSQVAAQADELIRLASPPHSRELAPFSMKELVDSVIYAHTWWIRYNKHKLRLLDPKEKMSKDLTRELIPNWENRVARLRAAMPDDGVAMLKEDGEIRSTYQRLVAAALRMIRVSEKADVYDWMLPEYMKMIDLIERKRQFESATAVLDPLCRVQPIIKWERLKTGNPFLTGSLEKWIDRLSSPRLNSLAALKTHLGELDGVLKELPVHMRPDREIVEWCRDVRAMCEKVEQLLRREKDFTFLLGLLMFLASFAFVSDESKTILRSLSLARLARSSPGIREWWERHLTGLLAGFYGLSERTGRYVMMMTNSLRFAGTIKVRVDPSRYSVSAEDIRKHYWPFSSKLEGTAGSGTVVP